MSEQLVKTKIDDCNTLLVRLAEEIFKGIHFRKLPYLR